MSDSDDSVEETPPKKISRLGNCEVCSVKAAKYTCPKCEVKTCCLNCNIIHKRELECDGIRNKVKFLPLNKFTDNDLCNDYRFLEEINQVRELCKKNSGQFKAYQKNLYRVAQFRDIFVKFLPKTFERSLKNKSRFNYGKKILYWTIDWIFPSADNLIITEDGISEETKLSILVSKYLSVQEDSVVQEKLKYYQSCGIKKIRCLLRKINATNKFCDLDLDSNLLINLKNKTVIEYPVIYVILEHHLDCYDIIDSDCEEESYSKKSGDVVINNIIKNAEDKESKNRKNFLFDILDSEDEV